LRRPTSALAWSGLAAGLSVGFSLAAQCWLRARLPDTEWRPLVEKLAYQLGFLAIILGRQQLFTENTLTGVIPLLTNRNAKTFVNVCRLWSVVLVANLVGAWCFAWVAGHAPVFDPEVLAAFRGLGHDAIRNPFGVPRVHGPDAARQRDRGHGAGLRSEPRPDRGGGTRGLGPLHLLKLLVDRDGGLGAFGRGDNDELHV
jgi:formate-nitrite transporter family protein